MNNRFTTILTAILILLLSISGVCFGQEVVEDENWLKGLGGEVEGFSTLNYWTRNFTKQDLADGKQRLKLIRQFAPENDWEGIYFANAAIGDDKLIWNAKGGFFDFYFYHELKRFDFGKVIDSSSYVELVSEKTKAANAVKKQLVETKLVKVKVSESYFLVPETRLPDFCDRAAGLTTNLDDFYYYWTREKDLQKDVLGLPVLPPEYKHLLRYQIETKIIGVGRKKIIRNEQSTKEYNFDDIHYPATLNAGKNRNVKVGMNFFVEDLGEWLQITKVFQTNSVGFFRRDFDENKQEQCRDGEGGSGQLTPCKSIKIGMKAKTKGSL